MIEVYRNTSEVITHTVYYTGTPTEVDNDEMTVTVKNPATGEVFTTGDVESLDLGRYQVRLPVEATKFNANLKAYWTYAVDGQQVTGEEDVAVVTPYVTPDEITSAYPVLQGKSYEELHEMERRVRLIINQVTGQEFGAKIATVELAGNHTSHAMPERLWHVHYITQGGRKIEGADIEVLNDGWLVQVTYPPGYYQVKTDTFLRPGGGRYSTVLHGTFGWPSVPNDINMAAKILVGDYFCNDAIYRQRGVQAVRAADWRLDFHDRAFSGTGNLDVDMLLGNYKAYNMVII